VIVIRCDWDARRCWCRSGVDGTSGTTLSTDVFGCRATHWHTLTGFLVKWFYSFLAERRQRVRVQGTRTGWLDLRGSMPQWSLLGLLLFLLLVDDLNTNCSIYKFVDYTTLTEILRRSQSLTQQYLDALIIRMTRWQTQEKLKKRSQVILTFPNYHHFVQKTSNSTSSLI